MTSSNVHWGHLDEDDRDISDEVEPDIKPITSAGILPFAVYRRHVFFLLGKEGYEPEYGDSDKWSDFAGKLNEGETVEDGACREFYEETAGCVLDLPDVKQRIFNKEYLLCCDLHPLKSTSFRTYLLLVPYRDYQTIFRRTKHFMQYTGASVSCIEKTQLNWFSYREVHDIVFNRWGDDRYRRKPKFRPKFSENLRRILREPNLQELCFQAYARNK